MGQDLALAVVNVLAAKGAETLAVGARDAVAAVVRAVRRRFQQDAQAADQVERLMAHPDDAAAREAVMAALAAVMAADPVFVAQVRRLLPQMDSLVVGQNAVVNEVSGSADRVVQARDIHGDITF